MSSSPFPAQERNNSICLHHRGNRATKNSCGIRVMGQGERKVLRGKSGAQFCFLSEEGKCPGWWSSTLLSKKQLCQCYLSTAQPAKLSLPFGRKELVLLARLDLTFCPFDTKSPGAQSLQLCDVHTKQCSRLSAPCSCTGVPVCRRPGKGQS